MSDECLGRLMHDLRDMRLGSPSQKSIYSILKPILDGDEIMDRCLHERRSIISTFEKESKDAHDDAVYLIDFLLGMPRTRRAMLYMNQWRPLPAEEDFRLEIRLQRLPTCRACQAYVRDRCALPCACATFGPDLKTGLPGCPLCTAVCLWSRPRAQIIAAFGDKYGPPTGAHHVQS